jgi:gluconolactonase
VVAAANDRQTVTPTHPLHRHAELPARFRAPRRSAWADTNLGGAELGCFLEGPAFDAQGNLYVVDIPFGRIFRLSARGEWDLCCEYDGWPNGLKILPDGRLLLADHRCGLVLVEPQSGDRSVVLDNVGGAPLLGLNDLTIAADGTIYATDQGETGLHDPRGRVLRIGADGVADCVLDNAPSPNGIVAAGESCLFVAMTRANAVWRVPLRDGRPTKVGLFLQLSGGIGPDGLALAADNGLIVAHPPIGVWRFDRLGLPIALYRGDGETYTTNLVLRPAAGTTAMFVTDSMNGCILTADLVA